MGDTESDTNLIKDFNESETEEILNPKKCSKHKKIIIISVSIALALIIVVIVLIFTVFKKNEDVDDDDDFSSGEIDTFTKAV